MRRFLVPFLATIAASPAAMADPVNLSNAAMDQITAGSDLDGSAFAESSADAFGDTTFAETDAIAIVEVDGPVVQVESDAEAVAVGDIFAETYTISESGSSSGDHWATVETDAYGFAVDDGTVYTESTTYAASSPTTSTAGGVSISYASGETFETTETSATTSGSGTIFRSSTLTRDIENDAFSASYTTSTVTAKDYPF